MKAILVQRNSDKWGEGHYGASRGDRKHVGIDYCCSPGSIILAIKGGRVTKLGYAYGDDLSFRYIEITDAAGYAARYFYVEPSIKEGDMVFHSDMIGNSQKLGDRYDEITEHVHFEVKDPEGNYIDPNTYYLRV